MNSPGQQVPNMLLEMAGEITPERMKRRSQSKNTPRPFMYDLNQIPYDYTVEVTNRVKGLDLIDRVPEEQLTEVCEAIPKKKKCKKAK